MLITGLKPNAQYTVVVEARKMQRYAEVDNSMFDMNHLLEIGRESLHFNSFTFQRELRPLRVMATTILAS